MRSFWVLLFPALLYGIDCARPESSAEKAVCSTPTLKAKDQEVERLSTELKAKLRGENAAILADTEMPFLRQRNNCSNEQDIPACLDKVLSQRQDLLRRVQNEPNSIREAIGASFYVDIGFVWKYWRQVMGRPISVFGCLILDDGSPRNRAVLETENQASVPLLFKSMPEEIAEFLDDQKPCAHWLVTIRKNGDKFILYADDVLGRPLP